MVSKRKDKVTARTVESEKLDHLSKQLQGRMGRRKYSLGVLSGRREWQPLEPASHFPIFVFVFITVPEPLMVKRADDHQNRLHNPSVC